MVKKIIKKEEKEALIAIAIFKKEQTEGKIKKVHQSLSELFQSTPQNS